MGGLRFAKHAERRWLARGVAKLQQQPAIILLLERQSLVPATVAFVLCAIAFLFAAEPELFRTFPLVFRTEPHLLRAQP
jgi:hypothetical protein